MSTTTATTERRRDLLRKAREGLEATPPDQWDHYVDEALAGVKRFEAQLPPRPMTAQEAVDLFCLVATTIEVQAAAELPTQVVFFHEEMADQIRRAALAFPGMFRRPSTGPLYGAHHYQSDEIPDGWLCSIAGVDVYECHLIPTEGATP
jgi:hypothetical protein